MPTLEEVETYEPILLTPDSESWDPYSDHYAQNEDALLDYEGHIVLPKNRPIHVLYYNPDVTNDSDLDGIIDTVTSQSYSLPAKGQVSENKAKCNFSQGNAWPACVPMYFVTFL